MSDQKSTKWINDFELMLSGGHPNSLGNTIEVVDLILKNKQLLENLYQCYFSEDEVVRLRVSNAFKRVCKQQPDWVVEYVDKLQSEISKIDQASTQWTLSQLFMMLWKQLSDKQKHRAIQIVQTNLDTSNDWIVLNFGMEALTKWTEYQPNLKSWLVPRLNKLKDDKRNSVAKRARKYLDQLA